MRKDTLKSRGEGLGRAVDVRATVSVTTVIRLEGLAKQQGLTRSKAVEEAIRFWCLARERSLNRQRRFEVERAMREAADQQPIAELLQRFRAQMESVGEEKSETGLTSAVEDSTVIYMESGNAVASEQISVTVTKAEADLLRERAASSDRTMAAELRRAIRAYLSAEVVS